MTSFVKTSLERVPVRLRASDITQSGWRLEATCEGGGGTIVRIELSPAESCYRGEGVFLGWTQAQLAEAYQRLTQSSDDGELELMQLG